MGEKTKNVVLEAVTEEEVNSVIMTLDEEMSQVRNIEGYEEHIERLQSFQEKLYAIEF